MAQGDKLNSVLNPSSLPVRVRELENKARRMHQYGVRNNSLVEGIGIGSRTTEESPAIIYVDEEHSGNTFEIYKDGKIIFAVDKDGLIAGGASSNNRFGICQTIESETDISTGAKIHFTLPCDCRIEEVVITAEQEGSVSVDVERTSFEDFPDDFLSITDGFVLNITDGYKVADDILSGWTLELQKRDAVRFRVLSNTGIKELTLSLYLVKTGEGTP